TGSPRPAPRGRSTSAPGCRSPCSPSPTWRRSRSSPRASPRRCWSSWRRWAPWSGPCSCCARSSATPKIAGFLDRPEPAVRQISHRARKHVAERRHRYDSDTAEREQITRRFLKACAGGDLNAVLEMLAPDVTAWSDGGGKVTAARRPLYGADHVGRFLQGVLAKPAMAGVTVVPAVINGELGVLALAGDEPIGSLTYDLEDGLMRNIRIQVNPDKLAGLRR
ncbi:LOW QUALITY PROTEIN: ECF sigma factor, partial [Streptomyces sp. C]